MPDDDDTLDGCELDFTTDADDPLTAALRPLFPDGVASDKWEGVFMPADFVPPHVEVE